MKTKTRTGHRTAGPARILSHARRLATRVESWADFANELFDPEHGVVARMIPDRKDRQAFLNTPEFREIDRILDQMMERFGVADGATPKKSGKFVVRLPRTLHFALEREAAHEGVSLNQLVVAKLSLSLGGIAHQRGA